MIDIKEAYLTKLVANKFDNDPNNCHYGKSQVSFSQDEEKELSKILLKPFERQSVSHEFSHSINIDLNVLFSISRTEYLNSDPVETSRQIMSHLINVSDHPNIRSGDVLIARFEDVLVENSYYEALGVFKFEEKQNFMDLSSDEEYLKLKSGIGTKPPEKACLILFTEEPYTILIIDNGKNADTDYWQRSFIMHQPKNDDANSTHNFLNMTKSFIVDELPNDLEIGRADQIDMLNRSVSYFKAHDTFELKEFEEKVISQPDVIDSFERYRSKFQNDTQSLIAEDFTISKPVLKKQARNFKSVLKLDKNFHVYIHGNRNLIEQGVDENGRKFYRLFYEEEL